MALLRDEHWELEWTVEAEVYKCPAWETIEEKPMNQEIFKIVQNVQEILMSMEEEDQQIRDVMRSTASTMDLQRHFQMLRHYHSKLKPLLDSFEFESFRDMTGEKSEAAAGV